jgi:hypothetical protein
VGRAAWGLDAAFGAPTFGAAARGGTAFGGAGDTSLNSVIRMNHVNQSIGTILILSQYRCSQKSHHPSTIVISSTANPQISHTFQNSVDVILSHNNNIHSEYVNVLND